MTQKELSMIPTPSTAGILKVVVGEWGEMLINIGVLISVLSSWLAWTMICAEIPMAAAQNGTFPKSFARKNDKGSASVSLWASSILMQLVVLMVYFSSNAWLAMLAISALTVLPAYLMSTAYLCKLCITGEYKKYAPNGRKTALVTSLIGILFCLFMVYASEVKYLAMVPILLTLGLPLFIFARIKDSGERNIFQPEEMKFLICLIILDLFTGFLFLNDTIKF